MCICISDLCELQCCEIMAELVESLQSVLALGHHRNSNIPAFLTPTLRNVIISLARLPLVNSYTRIPPLVSEILLGRYCLYHFIIAIVSICFTICMQKCTRSLHFVNLEMKLT